MALELILTLVEDHLPQFELFFEHLDLLMFVDNLLLFLG